MASSHRKQGTVSEKKSSDKLVKELRERISELETLQKNQQELIRSLQEKIGSYPDLAKFSPKKLHKELVNGIRLLGERITQSVQEINQRHESFSEEIAEKFAEIQSAEGEKSSSPEEKEVSEFASLKENELLNEEDFEIVHRDVIQRLVELSRQQAEAVKENLEEQKLKIADMEKKIATLADVAGGDGSGKRTGFAIILSIIAIVAAIIALVYQLF